ncbi:MAG: SURF1 family protein [Rhodospirillales bacterium]|nr:SURF1 family protein [Rhodospirillales bacterium]
MTGNTFAQGKAAAAGGRAGRGRGWRGLLLPGFLAGLLAVLLVGLGVWQLHRLKWKLAILAEIGAAEAHPGIPLSAHPGPFSKVAVHGRLRLDLSVLYGDEIHITAAGPVPGGQLVVPLERSAGPPILVDLGWVPLSDERPAGLPTGRTIINGFILPGAHPGLFSAPDDPAARRFYTLDPARIGAALGIPQPAPFTLIALGPRQPGVYPMPAEHLPHPPNNHLQYALTWFGLALVVVLEFGIWTRQQIRA